MVLKCRPGQLTIENKITFYTATDENGDLVVFKAPNAGNTHGSFGTIQLTELAPT